MTSNSSTSVVYYSPTRCHQPCRYELPAMASDISTEHEATMKCTIMISCTRCGYQIPRVVADTHGDAAHDNISGALYFLAHTMARPNLQHLDHLSRIRRAIDKLRAAIIANYHLTATSTSSSGGHDDSSSTLHALPPPPPRHVLSSMVRWVSVRDRIPLSYAILWNHKMSQRTYDIRLPVIRMMVDAFGCSLHDTASSSSSIWHWFAYESSNFGDDLATTTTARSPAGSGSTADRTITVTQRHELVAYLFSEGIPMDIGLYTATPPSRRNLLEFIIAVHQNQIPNSLLCSTLTWFASHGALPPHMEYTMITNDEELARYHASMDDDEKKWRRELKQGTKVHVCDTVDRWVEAVIMGEKDSNKVLIHYDGWSRKWDEWMDRMSPKLILADLTMNANIDRTARGIIAPYMRWFTRVKHLDEYVTAMMTGHHEWITKRTTWFDHVTRATKLLEPLIHLIFIYHGTLLYHQ